MSELSLCTNDTIVKRMIREYVMNDGLSPRYASIIVSPVRCKHVHHGVEQCVYTILAYNNGYYSFKSHEKNPEFCVPVFYLLHESEFVSYSIMLNRTPDPHTTDHPQTDPLIFLHLQELYKHTRNDVLPDDVVEYIANMCII